MIGVDVLNNKNIVLGVTGSIAAYKAADIVSRLKKLKANVNVIMTESATKFISPLTLQILSSNYVAVGMFDEVKSWEIEHISLATKADIFVIAPATANIIGKIANGIADDLLTTTVMATKAPVLIAPAMNVNMYENKITQENINKLKSLGYKFIEPATGILACGVYGKGKLADVDDIISGIVETLSVTQHKDLAGVHLIVTAGPTQEPIDPVRYITNRSSGKMGYSIAERAHKRGAEVLLITGPTGLPAVDGIKTINIKTCEEMLEQVRHNFEWADAVIMAAAVADYRPEYVSEQKIKKDDDAIMLKLVKNPDILEQLGKIKGNKKLVGFAAETEALYENAKKKIDKKNLDMIVANDVTEKGAGFEVDTNIISIIDRDGKVTKYPLMSKMQVADAILDRMLDILK
ncbi:bifunctional phosphopantothenoylcysteine decarboxylase/phosphopantothenate--cysteine ligase CoaBC [Calorimonas adulescens]|uniref:Coenzyme A biosynthesis bifunctional protein CoaBC n=1 Tax=Calorimonas adulescens TaxID=2606906 RepID=A0A5D8QG93_9THEO|nr:bifunctional phosphopantothenoylcysteine decarboxylase/phosphopantothenate--cysteine ligase CoaBC [Calorimonas adulescens]TZE83417.1 bifunctional phosphopantothenoylcysteine decarboxylase/phosphopantothenate--cysteine ligase CoaBC [Calorimonas adulescens]